MTKTTGEAGGAHYGKTDPFVLTRAMATSGNVHADFCRCNIIKYGFRNKGDRAKMIDDLKKAEHYAREGWQALEAAEAAKNQPELPFAERLAIESFKHCHCPPGNHSRLCLQYTCPVCDGGPGNNGVCSCPKETQPFAVH